MTGERARLIIDAHCHIYPEKIAPKAITAVDGFYGGLPEEPLDGTAATLLERGGAAGISRFVVHSVATTPHQVGSINRFIAGEQEKSGGRLIGLGTLHPESENPRADVEQILAFGLHGVKLHPDIQGFQVDCPEAMRLFEVCEEAGLPVLVHTGDYRYDNSNPERTVNVLRAFPRLTFAGAHFGGWSVWDRALALLPDFPNIVVDTSSSFYWMDKTKAMTMIRAFGAERVMFGTDYPMWDPRPDLEFMEGLDLSEEERELIFHGTCERVYRPGSVQL